MLEFLTDKMYFIAYVMVFMPLLASIISGYFSLIISPIIANILTCTGMFISMICALIIFYLVINHHIVYDSVILQWFSIGKFSANWSIYIDSLTATMLVAVTIVSFVVHVYSVGYMETDLSRQRFTSYLSLFTFAMMMLVCANNFIQLFFGWEGVGLCSYLLIGFWYKRRSANSAAIKAFLMNRIGDIGLALGIFLIYQLLGSLEYKTVFANVGAIAELDLYFLGDDWNAVTLICILIFVGCMGKSAQIGLHTWLPDAMEGPTPVSALIHAATMVTAGVFLVARCSPLFEYSQQALHLVIVVGAITSIMAAGIALVQCDIKKIIAYSTCSQLGYMFFACGVSAYAPAIFHLLTHAFFKALLFLAAGSVIHALNNEQDIRKMGGIWKQIPITYSMFWIGSLALAGIFPFSGFYSKDAILEYCYATYDSYGMFAYWTGVVVAFMTAFYSWRLLFLTFHGKPHHKPDEEHSEAHESPAIMLLPLLLLVIGSIGAGFLWEKLWHITDFKSSYWQGVISVLVDRTEEAHHLPMWVVAMPSVVAIFGIILAYVIFIQWPSLKTKYKDALYPLKELLLNKFYFDYIYDHIIVNFVKSMSILFWKGGDQKIVDNIPGGLSYASGLFGKLLGKAQSGYFYHYAATIIAGLLIIMAWLVVMH